MNTLFNTKGQYFTPTDNIILFKMYNIEKLLFKLSSEWANTQLNAILWWEETISIF